MGLGARRGLLGHRGVRDGLGGGLRRGAARRGDHDAEERGRRHGPDPDEALSLTGCASLPDYLFFLPVEFLHVRGTEVHLMHRLTLATLSLVAVQQTAALAKGRFRVDVGPEEIS